MDKPFSWTSADGTQSFLAVLHLSSFGAFKSADVTCRNMKLMGLNQQQFLQLIYEGIGVRAATYDTAPPEGTQDDTNN